MRPNTRLALALAVAVVVVVDAAVIARDHAAGAGAVELAATTPTVHSADVRRFDDFALYSLGDSFEGLPLKATMRRNDTPVAGERISANYIGFIYGDCAAGDDMGCPPPLEVQIWPACERTLADYSLTPAGDPLPHESTMVRGVPAAFFEEGLRLELYTGKVTIVVFGLERNQIIRAASALRAVNRLASDRPILPPPVPGAVEGKLSCD